MKILHLEDSLVDAGLVAHLVDARWPTSRVEIASTRNEFLVQVQKQAFDVILSDYTLPSFDGLSALRLAQQFQPDTPFIFCSGTIGEDRAIEAMREGATDYVLKDKLNRLIPSIERAVIQSSERVGRKEAERALRRSERRYRALINATAEIVWSAGPNGEKPISNPPWEEFTGISIDPGQQESWLKTIHPDDRLYVIEAWEKSIRTRQPYNIEFRVLRADQEWRYMNARAVPELKEDGTTEEWIGVCVDITARKKAEDAERRLILLLENTTDFVAVENAQGELIYSNPASRRVFGDPLQAGSADRLYNWYTPEWQKRFLNEFVPAAIRDGTWSGEAVMAAGDGREIPVSQVIVASKDSEGQYSHLSTIIRDISEAKAVQRKLREQAEVITQARDAVVITDLEHRITFWNRGAERLYGWTAAEVMGLRAEDLFEESALDQVKTMRTEALDNGSWTGEMRVHNRDHQPIFVEARATLVHDEHGHPKARLIIVTDITEKKNLEEQFLRAQRMDNLGLLAAGISHDLNNILAPILMIGPLIRSRLFDASDHKLVDTLEQSAQRGADMVHQILSFARGASGELGVIQIRHLLRDILQIIENTFPKNVAVRHRIASDLSAIRANPTQIHQLLLNLCVNARDAMLDGGTLLISAEDRAIGPTTGDGEHGTRTGNYVVIEVSDTGTGIPPEVLARMWEPFYTTKAEKGTGLGLSTVRGIIETHQGFVETQTQLGRGTTFRVYLPAIKSVEDTGRSATPFAAPLGRNETILIADDEERLREMIGTTLAGYNYQVLVASSPADAIEQASLSRDRIRLLVTDVSMPIINGNALATIVRRLVPGIKVLVISGHTNTEPFGDMFLQKPFKSDALLEAVHRLLSANPPSV